MRRILLAFALVAAATTPAQAQYTVTISGTGAYDSSQDAGDVADILASYGTSITYSSTFVLDAGILYSNPFAVDYSGHTTSMTVNGVAVPLVGPAPFASTGVTTYNGSPLVQFWTQNMSEPRGTDDGFVLGLFQFTPPDFNNGELSNDIALYPKAYPFYFVVLGGEAGAARYQFTLTAFTVTGTQPTLTPYIDPNPDPNGPVPEPATWAMLLAGSAISGMALRRRRSANGQAGSASPRSAEPRSASA